MNKKAKRVCAAAYLLLYVVMTISIIIATIIHVKNKEDIAVTPTYISTSERTTEAVETTTEVLTTTEPETTTQVVTTTETLIATTVTEAEETPAYDDEVELLALVTIAEAEGESEYGKRLVIDTVLNRVDSEHYPDTIYGVIYQPHQFTSMTNGRVDRCVVTDEVRQLVREEMASRTNYDVIFFRTDHYSQYGTPLFQVGCHYFSAY